MKTGLIVAIETDSIFDYYKDWEALDAPSGFDLYKINTKNGELYVLHTGMGEIAAVAGVQFLVSGVGVERVINFGVVGGLTEEMQKSKVCAVERVVHYKYDCSEFMDLKPDQLPEHDSIFLRTDKALLNKALSVMPELKKITACVLGFGGIILLNFKGLDFKMNFFGDAFVLFSGISLAFSSVMVKSYSKTEDPVVLSGYQFVFGGAVMIMIGILFGGRITLQSAVGVGILIYLAFLSAAAYSIWGLLLKYNPVSKITIYNFTTPVLGVILSKIMLAEQSNVSAINLILTLVLVSGGIILLNYRKS